MWKMHIWLIILVWEAFLTTPKTPTDDSLLKTKCNNNNTICSGRPDVYHREWVLSYTYDNHTLVQYVYVTFDFRNVVYPLPTDAVLHFNRGFTITLAHGLVFRIYDIAVYIWFPIWNVRPYIITVHIYIYHFKFCTPYFFFTNITVNHLIAWPRHCILSLFIFTITTK